MKSEMFEKDERIQMFKKGWETCDIFSTEVGNAGGYLDFDRLANMSAIELLYVCATNNISFKYEEGE